MTFVILQPCCNDASCVDVCPVDCIHPTPDEQPFMRAEMLHIDPQTCIDCGACVDECPVDAIRSADELEPDDRPYLELNARYFDLHPSEERTRPERPAWHGADFSELRVAIVGSGPAAFYAAAEILSKRGARVEMFERLWTPYGLVRAGVAPDHPGTKGVTDIFKSVAAKKAFALHLGVRVGVDITHDDLMAHHHAVVYAVGASADTPLNIDGEDLPGVCAATEFVGWYNGHPDFAEHTFDLSTERVVIVGNGNVALDVARILLSDPETLAGTDIADHALEALRLSNVREVMVLGRRGAAQASHTNPELLALRLLPGVDVVVDAADVSGDDVTASILSSPDTEPSVRAKVSTAQNYAARPPGSQQKRLVLRYLVSPTRITGEGKVDSVVLRRNRLVSTEAGDVKAVPIDHADEEVGTGLVIRATGYRGRPVPDLPFDDARGVVPNVGGRVMADDAPAPGVYVAGWIKRGPSGGIGTNKKCSSETVSAIFDDFSNGVLADAVQPRDLLLKLLDSRCPDRLDFAGWSRVDKAERAAGATRKAPRVKMTRTQDILAAARAL